MHFAMTRRTMLLGSAALIGAACTSGDAREAKEDSMMTDDSNIDWANLTEAEWRERLSEEEFRVLRKEGTERAGTSPLNDEKRKGTFVCAGCELPLFASETKFESGTGWPSFYDHLPGALETKRDFKLVVPRTEYHCSRCGGHQGHVFKDGPRPTGLRYCNNGVALKFVPA
ncbi:peptide-methionine (R)-S-oxide reductase MsrB [Parvularcula marina]|uniref:peptide-methionine (R)-S-oxide reductase MsrB n=1 Tax=Parvularcula marina TaxID=2292771 RepID=UPI0035111657